MRKTPSLAGRAVLAVVMMAGFYLLAIGLCVGLGLLAWADLQGRHVHVKLVIVAAVTIGIVAWSVWPRSLEFPDPGVPLREQDQPELWRLVKTIANAAGQQPPAQLFLVGDVNAFVAERGGRLGFGGTRIMGIGLPLLQVLTVPQLKSVVAHEFGHFHGGDTRLGPFIYKTRDAIGRTIANFHKAQSLLHLPFTWYGNLFLRVTHSISRAQEFGADALSVQLVGREPVQTALRRVNEVAPLYERYVQSEYLPVLNQRVRPPLAGGFQLFLGSKAMRDVQVKVGEEAMQAKGNPYDTHPPLSERLAAAAEVEQPGVQRAAGPLAIELLRDVATLEGRLLSFLTGAAEVAGLPTQPWQQASVHALLANWRVFVAAKGTAFPDLRVRDFAAQAPVLESLALRIEPAIPARERRGAAASMLGVLLGSALHRAGWRIESSPGEPVVAAHGDVRIEPMNVAAALAEMKLSAAAWDATCREHGIGDLVLAGPSLPAADQNS